MITMWYSILFLYFEFFIVNVSSHKYAYEHIHTDIEIIQNKLKMTEKNDCKYVE